MELCIPESLVIETLTMIDPNLIYQCLGLKLHASCMRPRLCTSAAPAQAVPVCLSIAQEILLPTAVARSFCRSLAFPGSTEMFSHACGADYFLRGCGCIR